MNQQKWQICCCLHTEKCILTYLHSESSQNLLDVKLIKYRNSSTNSNIVFAGPWYNCNNLYCKDTHIRYVHCHRLTQFAMLAIAAFANLSDCSESDCNCLETACTSSCNLKGSTKMLMGLYAQPLGNQLVAPIISSWYPTAKKINK